MALLHKEISPADGSFAFHPFLKGKVKAEELRDLDLHALQTFLTVETRKYMNALQTNAAEQELREKRMLLQFIADILDQRILQDKPKLSKELG